MSEIEDTSSKDSLSVGEDKGNNDLEMSKGKEQAKVLEEEDTNNNNSGGGGGGPDLMVYVNTSSRFIMSIMFICAGCFFRTDVLTRTETADDAFKHGAIFFIVGTGLFLVATLIDIKGVLLAGNNTLAIFNSSLYVLAAISLLVGSVYFLPDVYMSDPAVGNILYVVGTLLVCSGLLLDMGRLMTMGATVPLPYVIAMFSALVGAVNFLFGACFLYPKYFVIPDAATKGGNFFITGGVFFFIHSLAFIEANFSLFATTFGAEKEETTTAETTTAAAAATTKKNEVEEEGTTNNKNGEEVMDEVEA